MRAKVLSPGNPRVIAAVFDTGEEPVAALTAFAAEHRLHAASFSAIGAFEQATLGYFNWERKDYDRIEVREQVEVLSLLGDLAFEGDKARVHAHAVLGRRDGSTCGGHLLSAKVRPTLEVILTQAPSYLERVHDAESGLALIRLDRQAA
jgi:predicted DNA-binding protein with PD1-like motif